MKHDVLNALLDKLREVSGLEVAVLETDTSRNGQFLDAKIRISRGAYQKEWGLECRKQLSPAGLPGLLDYLKKQAPAIVAATYITPKVKELLRQEQIGYVDGAGNLYLADDHLYLLVENHKAEKKEAVSRTRAFTKAGLKLLFPLLQQPEWVNEPYRFLARQAGVGLDTISKVYKALLKEKYLLPLAGGTYKWNNRDSLLTNWVDGYQKTLKPGLKKRTFKPLDKGQDWKQLKLPGQTYWGGANAGDLLTDYLIADHWTLYTEQDFLVLMKAFKWIPDPHGTITVIETFWEGELQDTCVPPLLAYADLTEGGDPRYLETANIIYEKHIRNTL